MNKLLMIFIMILVLSFILTSCVSTSNQAEEERLAKEKLEKDRLLRERLAEAYGTKPDTPDMTNAIIWDFEDGNDHGFVLKGIKEGELPEGGSAWSIGPPDQYDGQVPVINEGCHHNDDGTLFYNNDCNQPFTYPINSRDQKSYLNTYNLSQWGDNLHTADNDQIATSPNVLLGENAQLLVWSLGGSDSYLKPALDADPAEGYINYSCGIAVLSADDNSILASVCTPSKGGSVKQYTIDLSEFAGRKVYVEVVDSFSGSWGWLAVDEIAITNSEVVQ